MSIIEQISPAFVWFRMKVGDYLQAKQDELQENLRVSTRRHALDRNDTLRSQRMFDDAWRLQGHRRRMAFFKHTLRL